MYGVPSPYCPSIVSSVDGDAPLGRDAEDRPVLELAAVDRMRRPAAGRRLAGHRQPQQQAEALSPSVGSGGAPRPSSTWHDEHAWALNIGPSPSRASVDAGAVTQFLVKKLSPISNRRRSSVGQVRRREGERVPRRHVARRVAAEVGVAARRRRRRRTRRRSRRQRGRAASDRRSTSDLDRDAEGVGGGDDPVGLGLERLDAGEHAGPARVVVGHAVGEVLVERRRDRLEGGDGGVDRRRSSSVASVLVGGREQRRSGRAPRGPGTRR